MKYGMTAIAIIVSFIFSAAPLMAADQADLLFITTDQCQGYRNPFAPDATDFPMGKVFAVRDLPEGPLDFLKVYSEADQGIRNWYYLPASCGTLKSGRYEDESERARNVVAGSFDKLTKQKLLAASVWLGMSEEQARLSWGNPSRIVETATADGARFEWVYASERYLRFEKGELTAYQK